MVSDQETPEPGLGSAGAGGDDAAAGSGGAPPSEPESLCGNGQKDQGEFCDDGNDVNGDGCNSDCIKSGYNYRMGSTSLPQKQILSDLVLVGDSLFAVGNSFEVAYPTKFDKLFVKVDITTETLEPVASVEGAANKDESLRSITTDGVALFTAGIGTNNAGNRDGLIERRSVDGTISWARLLDGPVSSADFMGGVSAGASSLHFAGAVSGAGTMLDLVYGTLSKTNSTAPVTTTMSTSYEDQGTNIAELGTDSVVVGKRGLSSGHELWVRRIDANAATVWTKTFAVTVSNTSVATGPDGKIAIAGDFNSGGVAGFDTWLMVLDSAGNKLWSRTFNHGGDESTGNVTFDPASGDVIIVGQYLAQSHDAFIQRFDADGNERWFQGYEFGGYYDDAYAVAVAEDGTIWAAGGWGLSADDRDYWVGQFAP